MENKVGYTRRNAFVPVPTVTSFEEFNGKLWEWCEQDAKRLHYKYKVPIEELWEADRESLLQLPEHPYPVFRYEAVSVNASSQSPFNSVSAWRRKLRSLPCSSFPHRTRFAGLRRGPVGLCCH